MSDAIESGMRFVMQPGNYFKIECCPTMQALGIKTCDFLIAKSKDVQTRVFMIEAKSSAPKPPMGKDIREESWDEFLQNIYEKMVNTLLVFIGLKVGRSYNKLSDLPATIAQATLSNVVITPCLVLKDHPTDALPPIMNAFRIRMAPIVKSFVLDSPLVLNGKDAIRYGLVEPIVQ